MPGSVTAGRAAFGRRAWRDAYDHLAAAGRDEQLGSDDLERLATTAYLVGADDAADRWVAAHDRFLRDGEVGRAVRCAFWLAYGLFEIPGGWLGDRLGSRLLCTLGSIMTVISMLAFSRLGADAGHVGVIIPIMILGLG